ncbi:hypothetical protein L916_20367, partial [Phytophthora nicotianae]
RKRNGLAVRKLVQEGFESAVGCRRGAKLRLVTPLRPVLRQETRWGSTHAMLRRYFELRGFLSMDDDELAEFLPFTECLEFLHQTLDFAEVGLVGGQKRL